MNTKNYRLKSSGHRHGQMAASCAPAVATRKSGAPGRAATHAFTLVELLVVIGIIAVLTAIFLPVFGRVNEAGRSSKCASNLRVLASAAQMYANDNDGKIVPVATGTSAADAVVWRTLLLKYLSDDRTMKVFICPSDKWGVQTVVNNNTLVRGYQPTSYGINFYCGTNNGVTVPTSSFHDYFPAPLQVHGNRLVNIPHPANTIFITDTGRPDNVALPIPQWTENGRAATNASYGYAKMSALGASKWTSGDFAIYPRHSGTRMNAAFYDGHVESLDLVEDIVAHGLNDVRCRYDYH